MAKQQRARLYRCPFPHQLDRQAIQHLHRLTESQDGTTISVATKVSTLRPENSPSVPGSPESLPTLEELLGLLNQEVVSVEEEDEEEDLGLEGLFWLSPDPKNHSDTVPKRL